MNSDHVKPMPSEQHLVESIKRVLRENFPRAGVIEGKLNVAVLPAHHEDERLRRLTQEKGFSWVLQHLLARKIGSGLKIRREKTEHGEGLLFSLGAQKAWLVIRPELLQEVKVHFGRGHSFYG